jgi:uncharacterized surface protein with fasciclin (FAS1) repeats
VNGQVAVNSGVPQTNVGLATTGYLYLPPATYTVSLVPTGQSSDHPFLGPLAVPVAGGHRYTVVALGQKDDPTHRARVIDETAAYQAIGGYPPDSLHTAHIAVNNIKGAPAITWLMDGKAQENGVAYGDYQAALWPSFAQSFGLALTGPPSVSMGQQDQIIANPPGADNMDCFFGIYPNNDTHTADTTSVLNPVAFLASYSQLAARTNGQTPTFDTFLAALKTTGLAEQVISGGPYLLFAPSDAAFAALPQDQRALLLADRKALAETLRYYMVEGYYPPGSLSTNGHINRTLTNLWGVPLMLSSSNAGLMINGQAVSDGDTVFVAKGTRVIEINKLILPATQPAKPAPGMPTTGAGATPVDLFVAFAFGAALALLLAGGLLRRRGAARR